MKYLLLIGALVGMGVAEPHPDLKFKLRTDLMDTAEIIVLHNTSANTTYTVRVRRREFRKQYRVYYMPNGNGFGDTVIVRRDTLVKFADIVMPPPRKWRWVSENFEGIGTYMLGKEMRIDTGHVSTFKVKMLSFKAGGNVKQMIQEPEPFNKHGGFGSTAMALGARNKGFYYGDL